MSPTDATSTATATTAAAAASAPAAATAEGVCHEAVARTTRHGREKTARTAASSSSVSSSSHLPCKKRKASNASNNSSVSAATVGGSSSMSSMSCKNNNKSASAAATASAVAPSVIAAATASAVAATATTNAVASASTSAISCGGGGGGDGAGGGGGSGSGASVSASAASVVRTNSISERRLPSKKRKESHEEHRSRKGSTSDLTTFTFLLPVDHHHQADDSHIGDGVVAGGSVVVAGVGKISKDSTTATAAAAAEDSSLFLNNHFQQQQLNHLPLRKASHDSSLQPLQMIMVDADTDSLSLGLGTVVALPELPNLTLPVEQQEQEPSSSSLGQDLLLVLEASSVTGSHNTHIHQETTTVSALDHLDALHKNETTGTTDGTGTGTDTKPAAAIASASLPAAAAAAAAAKQAQVAAKGSATGGGDDSSHDDTFASSGHRLLMEAIMMANGSSNNMCASDTTKSGSGASKQQQQQQQNLDHLPHPYPYRDRLDSLATSTNRDRLDSFTAPTRERLDSFLGRERLDSFTAAGGNNNSARDYRNLDSFIGRRDRLESWGGMSDLSVQLGGSSDSVVATAMAAASNLHHGYLFEDPDDPNVQAAAAAAIAFNSSSHSLHHQQQQHEHRNNDNDQKQSAIPSKISLQRDRLNSIASLGDSSLANFPLIVDGIDVTGDIQAFVAAAMASVGDQLEELAGAMEEVAGETMNFEDFKREMGLESDGGDSSVASPMIGAASDAYYAAAAAAAATASSRRPRAWSTSSGMISVDFDAVQAAVDAAEAASGSLGLQKMAPPSQKPSAVTSFSLTQSTATGSGSRRSRLARRNLPLKRGRTESNASSSTITSDERRGDGGIERIRERARAAAGYVAAAPHQVKGSSRKNQPPLKKRAKRASPETPATVTSVAGMPTPKVSNRSMASALETPIAPMVVSSSCSEVKQSKQGGQASQKWEGMYTCLLEFAEQRQIEETKNMTEEEKRVWIWDGNVPTTYKTKDGKALGRWVNNQRSAKSKGNLKDDREQRLIGAGLKWSVLPSNSWNEMLDELSIYIKDQHRQGKVWDGNVPTNYQIKTRPNGGFNGEDKNLGRWVNRQRSLYQSGKLRKDRQQALEGVGLKWSMLVTMSWDGMFDTLKEYVDQQRKSGIEIWDGNVPANYRTNDNPPRALGRWINRQRSAYAKNKLKKECVDKLNVLGVKWSVHHRQGEHDDIDDGDYGDFMDDEAIIDGGGGDSSGKENAEKALEAESEQALHAV